MLKSYRLIALLGGLLATLSVQLAHAQAYPNKPIKFVAATSAGATADLIARVLADTMGKVMGHTITVEAKPGADQIIGMEYVARGNPADGYTVAVLGIDGQLLLPILKKELRFDPIKELTMVAGLGEMRYVLVGPASAPYKNFKELIDAVKASPGKFNYGASGPQVRFPTLMLIQELGLNMVYVPFAGGAPYITAVASGTIDWAVLSEASGNGIKPRGRIYAVTGQGRSVSNPDVPTFTELGFPRVYGPAYALAVRTGTPQAIIDRLSAAAGTALASEQARTSYAKMQFAIKHEPAEGISRTANERYTFYREMANKAGIKPE